MTYVDEIILQLAEKILSCKRGNKRRRSEQTGKYECAHLGLCLKIICVQTQAAKFFVPCKRERFALKQALALEFCILTAARSGEVLGARWSEIDLGGQPPACNPLWIPVRNNMYPYLKL
jgi:integrase